MSEASETVNRIESEGVVAVIRLDDPDRLACVVEAIVEGGVRAVEITLTVPDALELLTKTNERFGSDILLGVGSVIDAEGTANSVQAGARFVVSPVFVDEVVQKAHELGVPVIPGALTPTEILTAVRAGAQVVKIFPADIVGMKFFKAVRAPMPFLKLMPTGGVTLTNADQWLAAGACAVGIGSALLDKDAITAGDFSRIRENARTVRSCIDAYRAGI